VRFKVVIIESERGWGRKIDEIKYFDSADEAYKFQEKFNSGNPPKVNGMAPDWYMQAEDPVRCD
jgi:hypothetical protein